MVIKDHPFASTGLRRPAGQAFCYYVALAAFICVASLFCLEPPAAALSRNSRLHRVLPKANSSTSSGCTKQRAHDTFEFSVINAGRSILQQVLPTTYSSTTWGVQRSSHSLVESTCVRLHCKP